VGLGQPPEGQPIAYDPNSLVLVISPEQLPRALKSHLKRYREELLNTANVPQRETFERQFDRDFGVKS
jgi:hypothetical protein